MGYARGDTVIHPRHGVAVITGVAERDVGSGPVDYLELFVEQASLTIMVPAAAVAHVGIRDVSTQEQAHDILALLEEVADDVPPGWAERNARTIARMRSADLGELARVVRDLTHHAARTGKQLSSSERTSRDACIDLLARELSLSLHLTQDETAALIVERTAPRLTAPGPGTSAHHA